MVGNSTLSIYIRFIARHGPAVDFNRHRAVIFYGIFTAAAKRVIVQSFGAKNNFLFFALKMGVVLTSLIFITQRWGVYYVDALLPLYRGVIDLILHDYRVLSLSLSQQHAETIVAAHVITIKSQIIGGRTVPIGVTLDASTLADHALKHVIIVVGALLIWPGLSLRERGLRFLVAIPFLFLLEVIDIPFAIAGAIKDVVFFNLAPDYADNKPWLVRWLLLLDGGGRLLLSMAVPIAVAALRQDWTATDEEEGNCHRVETYPQ